MHGMRARKSKLRQWKSETFEVDVLFTTESFGKVKIWLSCGWKDMLGPNRIWTDWANATLVAKEASQAVLKAIKLARVHQNTEKDSVAILQIAQEASRVVNMNRNHDNKGNYRLLGEETTIADVPTKIPLFRWPMPAKWNGRTRED
jgi:hypothetical protein